MVSASAAPAAKAPAAATASKRAVKLMNFLPSIQSLRKARLETEILFPFGSLALA